MENTSLATAKLVMAAISAYNGPMELSRIVEFVCSCTELPQATVLTVVEFLQEVKKPASKVPATTGSAASTNLPATCLALDIDEGSLDLFTELSYNYQVAKALLKKNLKETMVDPEEVRKNLRTISTFLESALKLQERLYNAQQMQKFQEAIFVVLDEFELRDEVVLRLQEAEL